MPIDCEQQAGTCASIVLPFVLDYQALTFSCDTARRSPFGQIEIPAPGAELGQTLEFAKHFRAWSGPSTLESPLEAAITPDQFEKLVASAATFGPEHLALILLGGDAGLRSGEISALRWDDVDLGLDTLYIRRNFAGCEVRAPKCSKTREVPLTDRLRAALLALRAVRYPSGHVLQQDGDRPVRNYQINRWLARIADYAGLPAYGPHALRHAFGARLMLSGAGARVVMELLGHSSLHVTQVYTHATADHRRAAIRRLSTDTSEAPART